MKRKKISKRVSLMFRRKWLILINMKTILRAGKMISLDERKRNHAEKLNYYDARMDC